jgi:predicted Holliday junction resolvase-like endonuclease
MAFLLLVSMFVVFAPLLGQNESERIADQYLQRIKQKLKSKDCKLNNDAENTLRNKLTNGIKKIKNSKDREKADVNIDKLISEILKECSSDNTKTVTNAIIGDVLKKLCPLYPIC